MRGMSTKADETPEFISFWNAWKPHARHTDGRGDARDCFLKHVRNGADPQDIVDGARWFLHTMKERDREFIPLAASWMGRRAYEDLAEAYRAHEARKAERTRPADNVVQIPTISPERRQEMAARARELAAGMKVQHQ